MIEATNKKKQTIFCEANNDLKQTFTQQLPWQSKSCNVVCLLEFLFFWTRCWFGSYLHRFSCFLCHCLMWLCPGQVCASDIRFQ